MKSDILGIFGMNGSDDEQEPRPKPQARKKATGKSKELLTLPEALLLTIADVGAEGTADGRGWVSMDDINENFPEGFCSANSESKNRSSTLNALNKQGKLNRKGDPGAYMYQLTDAGLAAAEQADDKLDVLIEPEEDEVEETAEEAAEEVADEVEEEVAEEIRGELTIEDRLDKLEGFVLKVGEQVQKLADHMNEVEKVAKQKPAPAKQEEAKVPSVIKAVAEKHGIDLKEYEHNGHKFVAPAELKKAIHGYVKKFGEGNKTHGAFAYWLVASKLVRPEDKKVVKSYVYNHLSELGVVLKRVKEADVESKKLFFA